MRAVITFHPEPGDTLLPFWYFEKAWANSGNLWVDYDVIAGFPCDLPWIAGGFGGVWFDHQAKQARLDLDFRVAAEHAAPMDTDKRYCLARIRIRHKRNDLAGCSQPICIELARVSLEFGTGRVLEVSGGENRFVTWNSTSRRTCAACRGLRITRAWEPKRP